MLNSNAALAAYYNCPSMNPTTTHLKTAFFLANPHSEIVAYCTYFLKLAPYRKKADGQMGLSENALRNYVIFCQHFTDFELEFGQNALTFAELDRNVVEGFTQWLLDKKQFSQNYAGRLLGTLKTLCLDAKKSELKTHPYVQHISGFTQRRTTRIINILTFKDLHAIQQVPLRNI